MRRSSTKANKRARCPSNRNSHSLLRSGSISIVDHGTAQVLLRRTECPGRPAYDEQLSRDKMREPLSRYAAGTTDLFGYCMTFGNCARRLRHCGELAHVLRPVGGGLHSVFAPSDCLMPPGRRVQFAALRPVVFRPPVARALPCHFERATSSHAVQSFVAAAAPDGAAKRRGIYWTIPANAGERRIDAVERRGPHRRCTATATSSIAMANTSP